MSVYFQSILKCRAAGLPRFLEEMAKMVPVLEATAGWKLHSAFVHRSGLLHVVIDIWELRDLNHYDEGIQALTSQPNFPDFITMLDECLVSEEVVFLDKAPYSP